METRRATRSRVVLKVSLRLDQQAQQKFCLSKSCIFEVEIVDISIGGVGVFSKYFLPKGLIIEVEIEGESFGFNEPMRIKSEIRYCNYVKASRYRCGIKFIDISDKYQKSIADFIIAHEKRTAPRYKLAE